MSDELDRRLRDYFHERLPKRWDCPVPVPPARSGRNRALAAALLLTLTAAWYAASRPLHRADVLTPEAGTATVPARLRR